MTNKTPFGRAVRWAFAMTLGQRGASLVLTFLLAAILGPLEFGVIAMAMAYILFIEMFVVQGMGAAIIQRKDLEDLQLDSVFVLLLGASVLLAGLSLLCAGWWAGVNDLPLLQPVIQVLSLSIPIRGLTVIQQALLERDMKFKDLALLRGGAVIGAGAAGVVLALLGAGVWALVAQNLLAVALASALMWRASVWRPRPRFSWPAVRALFGFSGGVFASQIGTWLSAQADSIVMGLFFGPLAVGLYRIGERIMSTLLEVTTRSIQVVALPHFSDVRDDPEELHDAVLDCVRLSATITIPLLTIVGMLADDLLALLGDQWAPAAGVLRVVIIMGMAKSIVLFTGPLFYALGHSRLVAVLVWILGIATAAGLIAGGVALRSAAVDAQIVGIAIVRTGILLVFYVPAVVVFTSRLSGVSVGSLVSAMTPAVAASTAVTLVSLVLTGSGVPDALGPFGGLVVRGTLTLGAAIGTLLAIDTYSRDIAFDAYDNAMPHLRTTLARLRGQGPTPFGEEAE